VTGYPHRMNLAYGIPFSGRNLPPKLVRAFSKVQPPINTNTMEIEITGKPIDVARNRIVELALEHKAKWLFFWDEDVLLPPDAVRKLVFEMEQRPSAGIIGGIYVSKTLPPEPLVFNDIGDGSYWDWQVGQVFPIYALGMGCAIIRMEIFKDLEAPWFRTIDEVGERWTEDIYFCHKLMETGKWQILAHGGLLCPHVDIETGDEFILPTHTKPFMNLPISRPQ
jgi:hypothetical protein